MALTRGHTGQIAIAVFFASLTPSVDVVAVVVEPKMFVRVAVVVEELASITDPVAKLVEKVGHKQLKVTVLVIVKVVVDTGIDLDVVVVAPIGERHPILYSRNEP